MTTTIEETTGDPTNNKSPSNSNIPEEIMNIMENLSRNSKIIFKSQQRNEPELQESEKLKVALDVYQRNPQTFLIRFGSYMEESHLQNFARLSIADSDVEMHLMVKDYQNKLRTRQRDIKNRRYTALQKLIGEGEYFSELEMMKRQPELYQELVGQYLSNKEKQQRDCYDVRNTTFAGILMHNLEQKQLNEVMEKAQNNVTNSDDQEILSSDDSTEKIISDSLETDDEVPLSCRQQWGNFDNEQISCSSSKLQTSKSKQNKLKSGPTLGLIMADERELLRQEFISRVHEQFLAGQDKDFDYSTVDDNTQFDDLNLINQDKEDKYFDESDDDSKEEDKNNKISSHNKIDTDESEDELDAYMSHLNRHQNLQLYNKN